MPRRLQYVRLFPTSHLDECAEASTWAMRQSWRLVLVVGLALLALFAISVILA